MPAFNWKHFICYALVGIASALGATYYTVSVVTLWHGGVPEGAITILSNHNFGWVDIVGAFGGYAAIFAAWLAWRGVKKQVTNDKQIAQQELQRLDAQILESQVDSAVSTLRFVAEAIAFADEELLLTHSFDDVITAAERDFPTLTDAETIIKTQYKLLDEIKERRHMAVTYLPKSYTDDRENIFHAVARMLPNVYIVPPDTPDEENNVILHELMGTEGIHVVRERLRDVDALLKEYRKKVSSLKHSKWDAVRDMAHKRIYNHATAPKA